VQRFTPAERFGCIGAACGFNLLFVNTVCTAVKLHSKGTPVVYWQLLSGADCLACVGFGIIVQLLLLLLLPSRHAAAAAIACLAVALCLAGIVIAIADATYFVNMGDDLDLTTLQLAVGGGRGMLLALLNKTPWAAPLLPALVLAYGLSLAACSKALRALRDHRCRYQHRYRHWYRSLKVQRSKLMMRVAAGCALVLALLGMMRLSAQQYEGTRISRGVLVLLVGEGLQQLRASTMWAPEPFLSLQLPLLPVISEQPAKCCTGPNKAKSPPADVVLVVLEGVRYEALQTARALRSKTLEQLRWKGRLVHAPHVYSTIPNTLKATYATLCGVLPEPALSSDYLKEFEPHSALLEGCLPRVLGRLKQESSQSTRHAYESTLLTSSSVLDGEPAG